MDSDAIELQELTLKILNQIDKTTTAYHIIIGALALALLTTFRVIKEDHGLHVMDQVKVDFYTFLSVAMQAEGSVTRKDLN